MCTHLHTKTDKHKCTSAHGDRHTHRKNTATTPLESPAAMENLEIKTNLLSIPSRSNIQTSIQRFEGSRDVHTTLDEGIFRAFSQLEWCQHIRFFVVVVACIVMRWRLHLSLTSILKTHVDIRQSLEEYQFYVFSLGRHKQYKTSGNANFWRKKISCI